MSSGAVVLAGGSSGFLTEEGRVVAASSSETGDRFLFNPWEMVPEETRRDPLLSVRFLKEEELPRLRKILPRIESEVLPVFVNLMRLAPNWDSYGARPIRKESLGAAIHLLAKLLEDDTVVPSVVPVRDGGIQLEWHASGRSVEIEISSNDHAYVYVKIDGEELEWEGSPNDVDFMSVGKALPRVEEA